MKTLRFFSLLFCLGGATFAGAQGTLSDADNRGIETTTTAFGTTLTEMRFDEFAKLFTDNCDFINIVGMHWHGKAQVVAAHRVVFTTRYRGVSQHTVDKSAALLAPGLVEVIETIKMDDYTAQDGRRMTDNLFRMTMILKKHGNEWLIRSAQNTVIDPDAAKHDPGNPS